MGAGRPIGTRPVNSEPSRSSRAGWNYPNVSHIYQIPIYTAGRRKAQCAASAGFPNVIRHSLKAASQDEFVYVKRSHIHSVKAQNHVQDTESGMHKCNYPTFVMWPGSTNDSSRMVTFGPSWSATGYNPAR